MNSKFEERLRYWLREASDQGNSGFLPTFDIAPSKRICYT